MIESIRLIRSLRIAFTLTVCAGFSSSVNAQFYKDVSNFRARAGVHVQTDENAGSDLVDVRAFVPYGNEYSLFFTDTRVLSDQDGNVGFNLGFGYRESLDDESMIGLNVFVDRRGTDWVDFYQLGAGWEVVMGDLIVRNNFYLPFDSHRTQLDVGLRQQTVQMGAIPTFEGNSLSVATDDVNSYRFIQAMRGTDFEVGGTLPGIGDLLDLKGFVGAYYFDNSGFEDVAGVSARLNMICNDTAEIDVFVQSDDFYKTNAGIGVTVWLGGGEGEMTLAQTVRDVMGTSVYRRQMVNLGYGRTNRLETGTLNLTNSETGNELTITHVDPNAVPADPAAPMGTFENPYTTLPATQNTDIVYLYADSVFAGQDYIMADNQRVLGEGGGFMHQVNTTDLGTIILPQGNGGAAIPMIQNSPGNAITLGNNGEVSNLAIVNPAANGIFAFNVTNSSVNNTSISTNGNNANGIRAVNSQIEILNNTIDTTGGGSAAGVAFLNGSGAVPLSEVDLLLSGNNITSALFDEIYVQTSANTDQILAEITGNTLDAGAGTIVLSNAPLGALTIQGPMFVSLADLAASNGIPNANVTEVGTIMYQAAP